MPFSIVRQNITRMDVDVIVNAANTSLKMGGGVCGAIFKAAGAHRLQIACDKLAPIKTGEAVITPGFDLHAKYIIHTAGPVFDSRNPADSERLLISAYKSSLELADKNNCESIAFPLISSGIFGYPKDKALIVARKTIDEFLKTHDMNVYLVVFDSKAFVISKQLYDSVESYIDENYVDEHTDMSRRFMMANEACICSNEPSIDDLVGNLDEPFSDTLLRLIDNKGMSDVEVYKRANIDRKLFSKIRKGNGYMPSKRTAVALAIALKLNLHETEDLLNRAGLTLSHSQKFDVIIEYFIIHRNYDIYEINEVLFKYDQQILGA